jgi:hypothetical protein
MLYNSSSLTTGIEPTITLVLYSYALAFVNSHVTGRINFLEFRLSKYND